MAGAQAAQGNAVGGAGSGNSGAGNAGKINLTVLMLLSSGILKFNALLPFIRLFSLKYIFHQPSKICNQSLFGYGLFNNWRL